LRDPDGYYIEIGSSHVLTKFCLGHKKYDAYAAVASHPKLTDSDEILKVQDAPKKKGVGLFAFFKLCSAGRKAKRVMANRNVLRVYKTDLSTFDPESVTPNPKILANFVDRIRRFGDIFNGKTADECAGLLKKYNNYAPDVVLEVIVELERSG